MEIFIPPQFRLATGKDSATKMAERLYATASQHVELTQYICYLINDPRRHPISTSTRLYLLDLLLYIRPLAENRHFRLDLRTFYVLRRTLWEIAGGRNVAERHFLQDVLRWTMDCHRERVWNRLRLRDRIVAFSGRTERPRYTSVRCRRCHEYGKMVI